MEEQPIYILVPKLFKDEQITK